MPSDIRKRNDDLKKNNRLNDDLKQNYRRNATLILNIDGVLIGFIVLIVAGKDLSNIFNSPVFALNVLSFLMSFSVINLFICFLLALFICIDFNDINIGLMFYSAVIYLIFGLLSLVAFVLSVAFGYVGLGYFIILLISAMIVGFLGILASRIFLLYSYLEFLILGSQCI